jgi:protein-tyrosine phosphatase
MRVQLYTVEPLNPGHLSLMAHPRGGDWLVDEVEALHAARVDVLVSLLTPEEIRELDLGEEGLLCQEQGIYYLSFPIQDRHVPSARADALNFLEQLSKLLLEGQHIAIHCWMGVGRTGLVAAGLLVFNGYTPQHAIEILSTARGLPVPETDEQRAWVVSLHQYIQESIALKESQHHAQRAEG